MVIELNERTMTACQRTFNINVSMCLSSGKCQEALHIDGMDYNKRDLIYMLDNVLSGVLHNGLSDILDNGLSDILYNGLSGILDNWLSGILYNGLSDKHYYCTYIM